MLKHIRGLFSDDMAIDLGTANTLIYMREKGIVLNEPSVVAIRQHNNQKTVVAVGSQAKSMLGRTPGNISAIRPLKDGVIADFQVTEKMLQHFIKKAHQHMWWLLPSPRVLVCVPCKSTEVERRAIRESALSAGARDVYVIEEPMAAALGASLPVDKPTGTMVVDVGGGTTEIAVISLNGVVQAQSLRVGGDRFDESITSYIRRKHGILIGETTAERIKAEVGIAYSGCESKEMEVRGTNVAEGVPRSFMLSGEHTLEAFRDPLTAIVDGLKAVLELTPPELSSDIAETGLVLTGGGSLLTGFDQLLSAETGLPVILAEDPLTCVARGGGRALELIDSGSNIFPLFEI